VYKKFICLYASDNDLKKYSEEITQNFVSRIMKKCPMFDGDHSIMRFRDGLILIYVPSRRDILFRRFNGFIGVDI